MPSLWWLEVANVLEMGVRRGRQTSDSADKTFSDLALLAISTDAETEIRAWGETRRLARRHSLTLYDASYLELSMRQGLPLASLDRELRAAAEREQVVILGR